MISKHDLLELVKPLRAEPLTGQTWGAYDLQAVRGSRCGPVGCTNSSHSSNGTRSTSNGRSQAMAVGVYRMPVIWMPATAKVIGYKEPSFDFTQKWWGGLYLYSAWRKLSLKEVR